MFKGKSETHIHTYIHTHRVLPHLVLRFTVRFTLIFFFSKFYLHILPILFPLFFSLSAFCSAHAGIVHIFFFSEENTTLISFLYIFYFVLFLKEIAQTVDIYSETLKHLTFRHIKSCVLCVRIFVHMTKTKRAMHL